MKTTLTVSVALVACLLCGCDVAETKYSEELTEDGSVYDVAYIPKGHGRDVAVGFTTGGDAAITPISVTIPERYAIVFKCEHGKFVVGGDDAKELYQRLERGDKVTIHYREVYKVSKLATNLVDLDFLNAIKK